ncbi:cytochrome p450 [Lichtheimia corymbifera JMRC:FSU:9682]|uniref:Cytochrome p450 n=1 Tax=Lichtheimia corymbifera JMRC:FSU:9682 TaxID=1263082 RepID=A0A068S441_9FUNG|nr:cytochrome p450 [Lichtheimia corymbifera JMRC:FSU:9682]
MGHLIEIFKSVSSQLVAYGLGRSQSKVTISTAIALVTFYMIYRSTQPPARLRHIPHVSFFTYLGAFVRGKSLNYVAKNIIMPVAMKSENGVYIRFDQNGWSMHITRPEAAKTFLLKTDVFPKAEIGNERGDTLLGKLAFRRNILTLNGAGWKAHRKIANPAFHRSMPIELFGTLCQKSLTKMMDELDDDGNIDFYNIAERFTLDAIGLAGFGFDFHAIDDPQTEWVTRYSRIATETLNPWFSIFYNLDQKYRFLFPKRVEIHREMDIMLNMIEEIIVHKRQTFDDQETNIKESERDLLTLMMEAEKSGEGTMTNDELRNNLCVFFFAGHDTTANALSYQTYYLAANPDIQSKAREEVLRVMGDAPQDVLPTLEQTRELPYLNMVIKEALRMSPPAANVVTRVTCEDTELAGTFIPKGTRGTVDIYNLHHNPTVWKDPETFRPERFELGGEAEKLAGLGMSWLPFSNGQRQCIGMNFSLAEQRVFLPMLLRKYEWHLPKDSIHKDGVHRAGLTGLNKPKDLLISFRKRY